MTKKTNKNYYFIKKPTVFLLTMLSSSVAFSGNLDYNELFNKNLTYDVALKEVTGVVTDTNGQPLPGATVFIKGTNKGTQTDFDGKFVLDVQEGEIIAVSYVGYQTQEVLYNGQSSLNITLKEETNSLNEVVVVGYSTKKRGDLTTAVSSVKNEDLNERPVATVNEALEGRAAGVQVLSNGSPGEDSAVLIRGLNTFGDGRPLYVVDGVFVDSLTELNPEAIESVDVLKDAAAAAIYGSRGSNGIIIITTKKGKAGKPKFTFSSYTGFQALDKSKLPDLLSGSDLVNTLIEEDIITDNFSDPNAANTIGNNTPARFLAPGYTPSNTDFTEALFRIAPIRNFNIGASGGSDKATFSLNTGYFDQEGIQKKTRFRRYTLNLNSNFKINNKFKVGQTLNLGYSKTNLPILIGGTPLQTWALRQPTYLPVRNEQGQFVEASRALDDIPANTENPLLYLDITNNESRKLSVNGSVFAEIKLFDGLVNKSTIAVNYFNLEADLQRNSFEDGGISVGDGAQPQKRIEFDRNSTVATTFTNILSYNKTFGDHNVNASAVFERIDTERRFLELINNSFVPNVVDQVSGESQTTSEILPDILLSYLGTLGYSYKNKYFINGSLRRDSSSKFGDRTGIFKSISGAWIVSNEDFLSSNEVITNLKLRAGFGETGNNLLDPFQTSVRLVPSVAPNIGDIGEPDATSGFRFRGVENPRLTWETAEKQNYGMDLDLWRGKVNMTLEYYKNTSENLIGENKVGESLSEDFIDNIGVVDSKGFEFSMGYNDNQGDFKWSFWGQVSKNEAEVVVSNGLTGNGGGISGEPLTFIEGSTATNISQIVPGRSLWGLYGFKTQGLFRSIDQLIEAPSNGGGDFIFKENLSGGNINDPAVYTIERTFDANGTPVFTRKFADETNAQNNTIVDRGNIGIDDVNGPGLGDIQFQDVNGDGKVDNQDIVQIGDPNPDFTYSFNLKASYKGFDASMLFTGIQGVDVINAAAIPLRNYFSVAAFDRNAVNRYSETNTSSNFPRYSADDKNANSRISDRYIEDGSYFRMKNLIIGYSFSSNLLNNSFNGTLSKLRVYIQTQNLFTITDYSGLDPEIRPSYNSFGTIGGLGIDRGTSPAPKSFLVGLQLEF